MKYFLILLSGVVFTTLLLLNSCNEEIDLVGDFKETAVVYGLLDKSDSVHYIKINRAFIGPGNSLEIAQIPDSSYFQQVEATIKEVVNGSVTRTWILDDTLVSNKETNGVFFAPEQKLYYFTTSPSNPLNANATYKLSININNGQFTVEGETELVSGIGSSIVEAQNFQFKFADNPASYVATGIAMATGNAHVINTKLKVNFYERIGTTYTMKSFEWNLGESEVEPGTTKTFTANGQTFYELVKNNVTNNASIDQRRLYSIEVVSTAGAEELYNYMTVNQPNSSLAQSKPTYTNLTASNGYRVIGIFSSRQTWKKEKLYINPDNTNVRMINNKSTVELCTGPITGGLFFCSHHPGDIGTSIACP